MRCRWPGLCRPSKVFLAVRSREWHAQGRHAVKQPTALPVCTLLSFKPQQRMQVDSGIPSDSMDAIIFAKLGSSLDHTTGVQVC